MDDNRFPLVSAVITTHNRKSDLEHAIKSVLNQTYINMECIVVDDASNDDTPDYMRQVENENPQVHYIRIDNSKGGNHARNQGIQAAKGEYIAFLDDDDLWFPRKIEKQMGALSRYTGCGVVYCGRIREINRSFAYEMETPAEYAGDMSVKIFCRIPCTTSTLMCRKAILLDVGMFDEQIGFWQEYELLMRLSEVTGFALAAESLVLYRCNFNDSARLTNKYDAWTKAVDCIYKKHRERIAALPDDIRLEMKREYLLDAVTRLRACGQKKLARKKLFELGKLTGEKGFYLRGMLNMDNLQNIEFNRRRGRITVMSEEDYRTMYKELLG